MASETKRTIKAAKTLHRLQAEQVAEARKLGAMRGKLDARTRKFKAVEAKMASLERKAFGPGPDGKPVDVNPERLRPACLFINPTSGSFERLAGTPDKLAERLRNHGIQAEVFLKTSAKTMRRWVRDAVKHKAELVIVAGGDGTIVDVASQLIGSKTVLGILPTGTMNNIAHELGIPFDIEDACALLGAGITRQIDMGRIRADEQAKDAYFLESAGLGLSVALPAGQNIKKGRWGRLPAAFREMFAVSPTPIEIELDRGVKIETKVQLVTVSNAPLFAMNNLIAPDAKMDDGLFDLAVYDGLSDVELAAYFLKTAKGTRVFNPNVRFYRSRRVTIRSERELPVTSDNEEKVSRQVLDFELLPRALTVIVGQGAGLLWPVESAGSVPPLVGDQAPAKDEPVAAPNGKVHLVPAELAPEVMAGANGAASSEKDQ